MKVSLLRLIPVLCCFALAACGGSSLKGGDFQANLGMPDTTRVIAVNPVEYKLGPMDKITINVFQMKELNAEKIQIDASGKIMMPVVGLVELAGRTTPEVAKEIHDKLAACCLQNPQVIVRLDEALSQQITVTGAVVESNIYALKGRTTLVEAITMAKGPDRRTADLKRVAIFRIINGQRQGALFNVDAINRGQAPDPEVFGGDQIIVDSSDTKSVWHGIVSTVPFLGVFAAL